MIVKVTRILEKDNKLKTICSFLAYLISVCKSAKNGRSHCLFHGLEVNCFEVPEIGLR